jgi:hypothetical protein
MGDDVRFEVGQSGGVPAERELGIDSVLDGAQPELSEPGNLGLCEVVVGKLRERRPAPKLQSSLHRDPCAVGIAGCKAPTSLLQQSSETIDVELFRVDEYHIAVPARLHTILRKDAPQTRNLNLNALHCARRSAVRPQRIDQTVDRYGLVGVQKEKSESEPLLPPAEIHRGSIVAPHVVRAE